MKRQERSFLFESFDSAESAFDLFQNSIRSGMNYDSNISDHFLATVLTRPVKVTGNREDISATFESDSEKSENFSFMVRIEGKNSPHRFLPNPCDIRYTTNSNSRRLVSNLIQQHTKVIMSANSGDIFPEPGSKIIVSLDRNKFGSFKTDIAKSYVEYVEPPPANQNVKIDCSKLKSAFDSGTIMPSPTAVSGAIRTKTRAYGSAARNRAPTRKWESDVPPFTKCSQDYYLDKPEIKSTHTTPSPEAKNAAFEAAIPGDPRKLAILKAISQLEQGSKGMPDFNPAGMQGDDRRWPEEVSQYVSYVSCKADSSSTFRIFLGFNSIEDGIKAYVAAMESKFVKNPYPAQDSNLDTDAFNVMKWYYMKWNMSLTEAEFQQILKEGHFFRGSRRIPKNSKYDKKPKLTQANFKRFLKDLHSSS